MSYDPHDHIARRSDIAAGFGIWLALLAGLAVGIGGLPGFSPADLSARSLSASVGMSQPSSPPVGMLSEPTGRADGERGPVTSPEGYGNEMAWPCLRRTMSANGNDDGGGGEPRCLSRDRPGSGDVMSADMSLSEKLVSSFALAVLLGGLASGVFAKRADMGHGSLPSVSNASAAHANYEIGRAIAQGPH